MTKWVSNNRAVLATIPDEDKAKQIKELDLDREKLPVERALGMYWIIENNSFGFQIIIKTRALTRRAVLCTVSSFYDPLGFVAPFTLKAKQDIQALCQAKSEWDKIIPISFSRPYERFEARVQLHHFCDASEQDSGTGNYIREICKPLWKSLCYSGDRNV